MQTRGGNEFWTVSQGLGRSIWIALIQTVALWDGLGPLTVGSPVLVTHVWLSCHAHWPVPLLLRRVLPRSYATIEGLRGYICKVGDTSFMRPSSIQIGSCIPSPAQREQQVNFCVGFDARGLSPSRPLALSLSVPPLLEKGAI
jgi:hypothetical protein